VRPSSECSAEQIKHPKKVNMKSNINPTSQPEKSEAKLIDVGHLLEYLVQIQDKRKRRGVRYRLEIILMVFILAKLCGQNKVYGIADWVQQRSEQLAALLNLKRTSMPHHSTYRRILTEVIVGEELEQIVAAYLSQLPRQGQEVVIAIDGKSVRGTITREDPFGLHLLAAYLPGEGIVLMQMEVEKEKENEITVAPKLLKSLDLRQKIVIGDAMHTQRQISTQIVEAGGDYVWIVKDNQAKTRQAIEKLFTPEKPIPGTGYLATDFRTAQTVTKQAGRMEHRSITVSCMLNDYLVWPYVGQVFKLERRFTDLRTGEINVDVVYGLTSLTTQSVTPEQLMKIIRSHWGIENGLHYRRDVTYQEDQTRMIYKSMGRAMSIINNLVISLLNNHGFTNHAQARRILDASPWKSLAK
jgi:predicted transposase YbfD/YdcC